MSSRRRARAAKGGSEGAARHVAVVALPGAYLSSLGTVCDALALLASQVNTVFAPVDAYRMQTGVVLLGLPPEATDARADATGPGGARLPALDGTLADAGAQPFRLVYLPAFVGGGEKGLLRTLRTVGPALIPWLRAQHDQGAVLAASGTAVLLLAEAGLLDGGHAAVLPLLEPVFRQRHPRVHADRNQAVVTWQRVHTCGSPAAEWALTMRMVEDAISPHSAQWLASALGLQTGLQPSLRKGLLSSEDPLVGRAQFWLVQHHTQACRIDELARLLAVSHATLTRRFQRVLGMTPRDYLRQLRVHAAQQLLQNTRRRVDQIAAQVGYTDLRAFRTAFQQESGASPSDWRRQHAKASTPPA